MKVFLGLLLLLALTIPSSAIYCLCNEGIGEKELQTAIDYACGTLADCNPIKEKGSCYQPITVKSHCDWAVNSYFQNAAQVSGSCDFSGTATTNLNPPSNLAPGCIYPSSPSAAGPPPSTTPPTGTTPPIGPAPPTGTTPPTGPAPPVGSTPPTGTTPPTGPALPNPTNGTTPFPGTPPPLGPPGTGGFTPSKGAPSLVISSAFTLCFSSLAFL
ncbi:X8 domain-containing protein [Hirschfeldia incana]|nr:X8 domain-containing protein [Hirschfeldia incana]